MAEGPSIGSVLMEVVADLKKFRADVVKEAAAAGTEGGEKAGKTFGEHLAGASKRILSGVAGGFAAGLTAGVIGRLAALDKAQADFRRETGATADEATRAGKAINDMAGRNIQPIEEIGKTLAAVTVQWGLHGDAAAAAADDMLKYARATGQDGVEAVNALDDVLDSWNLTAADSKQVMADLIASHQKYGGSIKDNQVTLAALAPAMQAANMKIDDGIALLGLFGSKGLDANTAAAAFAKALTKVKSPAELQSLITDISTTDDAFLRAQKAADVFGAKAGAKLANALAGAKLDDYKIHVDDAGKAINDAADASLTLADKVKMAFSQITSSAVELLGPAGPFLQGIAGLSTLLGPAIAGAGKKIGIALGAAIGAALGPEIAAKLALAALATGPIGLAAASLAIAIPIVFVVKGFDTETPGRTADERQLIEGFLKGSGKLTGGMRQVDTATTVIREFQDHGATFLQAVVAYIKKLEWSGDQVTQAYTDLAAAVARGDTKVVTSLPQGGLIPALRDRILGTGTPVDPGNRGIRAFIDYQGRLYDEAGNAQRAAAARFAADSERNHAEAVRREKEATRFALMEAAHRVTGAQQEAQRTAAWLASIPMSVGDALTAAGSIITASFKTIPSKVRGHADRIVIEWRHALTDLKAETKLRMAEVYHLLANPHEAAKVRSELVKEEHAAWAARKKAKKQGNVEAFALADAEYQYLKKRIRDIDKLHASVDVQWNIENINKKLKHFSIGGIHIPLPPVSLAHGTPYVTHDMLAQLHEGERVVPKAQNVSAGADGWSGTRTVRHIFTSPDGSVRQRTLAELTAAAARWED